jgi:hypothetical protein
MENVNLKNETPADAKPVLAEVFEWEIKNNAGEIFKFFIDEENRACLNIKFEKELLAGLIMSKKEFEDLINSLTEMMKNVSR